jgi:hypothetical protein
MTAALKYEQVKRDYIKKETDLIMSIKETMLSDLLAGKVTIDDIDKAIIQKSTLAQSLVTIYEDLRLKRSAHLVLNSAIDISMQLPHSLSLTKDTKIQNATLDEHEYPDIRPYHSLLLLSDPEEIVKRLPVDSSPLLVKLIQIVTPTQKYHFTN